MCTYIVCELFDIVLYTVPPISVSVHPSDTIALDIIPYNVFTLNCTAVAPDGVIEPKLFQWRLGDLPSQVIINDNGETVLISNHDLDSPQSTSVLTVIEQPIGTYTYNCSVSIDIPGVFASASASVTVQGKNTRITYYYYFRMGDVTPLFLFRSQKSSITL